MKKSEARLILLEQAVELSFNTIAFMHECLVDPKNYKYAYPNQTVDHLNHLKRLVKMQPGCIHSVTKKNCKSCQAGIKWRTQRHFAMKALKLKE